MVDDFQKVLGNYNYVFINYKRLNLLGRMEK